MAIKGKTKSRSSRSGAGAPRREPVPVPVPFFQRRVVQLVIAALAGPAIFLIGLWLVNGISSLSSSDNNEGARLAAAKDWQKTVTKAVKVSGVGETDIPTPPQITPLAHDSMNKMSEGLDSTMTVKELTRARQAVAAASSEIRSFDMVGAVGTDKGFTDEQIAQFNASWEEMSAAFSMFERADAITVDAAKLSGSKRTTFAKHASSLYDTATTLFDSAWSRYRAAIRSAGVTLSPAPSP